MKKRLKILVWILIIISNFILFATIINAEDLNDNIVAEKKRKIEERISEIKAEIKADIRLKKVKEIFNTFSNHILPWNEDVTNRIDKIKIGYLVNKEIIDLDDRKKSDYVSFYSITKDFISSESYGFDDPVFKIELSRYLRFLTYDYSGYYFIKYIWPDIGCSITFYLSDNDNINGWAFYYTMFEPF